MANTLAEARDVLSLEVQTAWDANKPHPTSPLLYDNVDGDRPDAADTGDATDDTIRTHGRLTIRHNSGGQASLGSQHFRNEGLLTVQLFVPQGTSTSELDRLGNAMKVALQTATSTTLGNVWLRNVTFVEAESDGVYHQANVTADFIWDETN